MVPTEEIARAHYDVHKERPFFPGPSFMTSGPVVCMAWQGVEAITVTRKLIGATNGRNADPGTIRGDFGMDMGFNMFTTPTHRKPLSSNPDSGSPRA